MRALRSSGPALPYIARLIVFRRLIWPSAWPLLPRQFYGVADGVNVTAQNTCEPFDGYETRVDGIVDPGVELAWITAPKDAAETHGEAAHQGELGGTSKERAIS
jgi:hypothetical protein